MRYVSRKEELAVIRAQLAAKQRRQARHAWRMGRPGRSGLGDALTAISEHAPLIGVVALFVGVPAAIGYLGRKAAAEREAGYV